MKAVAASEAQRSLPDGVDVGRLLDFLRIPVIVQAGDGGTWLNAPARELDDWIKRGDPARSLIAELAGMPGRDARGADDHDASQRTRALSLLSGTERRNYRARFLGGGNAAAIGRSDAWILVDTDEEDPETLQAKVSAELARARLEEVQRQLLQADRMSTIGQLAAGVAHEINNPIGYVQSNLETLRDYVGSLFRMIAAQDAALRQAGVIPPSQLAQVEKVRHEIDYEFLTKDLPTLLKESQEGISRVRKIIQDLREFSRAGHLEEWTFSDLHAGIDSTINIVWNDLKYKVELIKQYGDIPQIECLPSQLNQVFMNVLVNAGQAIEKRGQITIATHVDGDFVYVEFSDTGKGIAADQVARVFEPFFTTKPIGKGTGLGLSISYGIVRKHGGDIDVRSEPGVGTTFVIKLPLRQHAEVSAEQAGPI